jgi:hypothetical protein
MSNETYSNKVTQVTYYNSNVSRIKERCERCNKESDELKDYFIHLSDDFNRMNLCNDCEKGLWSYIDGAKLAAENN